MIKIFNIFLRDKKRINDSLIISESLRHKYNKTRLSGNKQLFCKAPFTGLNIKPNGIIGVCNVNTSYVYGNYPERKLKDIWNGEEIEELRQSMLTSNLSNGCAFCHKYLLDGNYDTLLAKNYEKYLIYQEYPSMILFENSHLCNLNCIMCFVSNIYDDCRQIQNVYNQSFLDELVEFIPHLKDAVFHGGEPFLIPLYYKIWDLILEINPTCEITIITNGTILNDKIKELLPRGRFQLIVSLESFAKSTYESIRVGSSFELIESNLDYFISYSTNITKPLVISTCVMQQNWKDIIEIVMFCNKNNCVFNYNCVFFPKECSIWNSTESLISDVIEYYKKVNFPQRSEIEKLNSRTFNILLNQIVKWKYDIRKTNVRKNLLRKKSIIDLDKLLISKLNHLQEKCTMCINDEKNFVSVINSYLSRFEDNIMRNEALIQIVTTPSFILNEALKLNNGLDLLFGKI